MMRMLHWHKKTLATYMQLGKKHETQTENSETKATPKLVWIRSTCSAFVAFSWQENKNEEIIIIITGPVVSKVTWCVQG